MEALEIGNLESCDEEEQQDTNPRVRTPNNITIGPELAVSLSSTMLMSDFLGGIEEGWRSLQTYSHDGCTKDENAESGPLGGKNEVHGNEMIQDPASRNQPESHQDADTSNFTPASTVRELCIK